MPLPTISLLAAFCAALAASTVHAETTLHLSSETQGFVRAGRAAALHVSADGLTGPTLTISATGTVPVQLPVTAGRVEATVPLLWSEPFETLTWQDAGGATGSSAVACTALSAGERLVLIAGSVDDAAEMTSRLFPDERCHMVPLDLTRQRLVWPPAAFDAADAVLLDASSAARVDESQVSSILAAGISIIIQTPSRPAGGWPWQQDGDLWVLRPTLVGPASPVAADVYLPTYSWKKAWPPSQRRSVLLAVLLGTLVLFASMLWRRFAFGAAVAVCVVGLAGAIFYVGTTESVVWAGGAIVHRGADTEQRDEYVFVSARRDAKPDLRCDAVCRPIYASRTQRAAARIRLFCGVDGSPERYQVDLPAGQTLAFLRRRVSPVGAEPSGHFDSVMALIADRVYPGQQMASDDQVPPNALGEWWGTVTLRP